MKENKVGPVELATISFGQRFEITPLQMITAVSSIANGGKLVKPRIVKQIINRATGEIENIEVQTKNEVISKKTAEQVLDMMKSVVDEGTGKNARVLGYSIGGKTGTSEDGVNTNKYVTSFIGVAPIENPEIVLLITLYNPTGEGGHQGGGVAAPIASQVFGEVLPYLDVIKNQDAQEVTQVVVPNVCNLTVKEAQKKLKDIGLDIQLEEQEIDKAVSVVTEQLPKEGIKISTGTKIFLSIN